MNNIEELKSKKPENLKSRSSVSADYVTDDNTGGYFVVECGNCGEVFPSQKLDGGDAIADSGDYGDAYCPHCNETDPDECANVGLVWNVQQAKINALIAQLEAVQKERDVYAKLASDVGDIITLLQNNEWAEHIGKTNVGGLLEYQITRLMNSIADINTKLSAAEAALSAAKEKLSKTNVSVGFLFVVKATGQVVYSIADWSIDGAQLIGEIYGDTSIKVAGFTVEGE